MTDTKPLNLDADFAVSLHPGEAKRFDEDISQLGHCWGWTGWKMRYWPAEVIRPGVKVYKFDLRPKSRRLCALLTITKGGAFEFDSMAVFADEVKQLTGRRPSSDVNEDEDGSRKWPEIEQRLAESRGSCIGICFCWEVVKPVSIKIEGEFPRLGWCDLRKPNHGFRLLSSKDQK
jgi:hypothetical protein